MDSNSFTDELHDFRSCISEFGKEFPALYDEMRENVEHTHFEPFIFLANVLNEHVGKTTNQFTNMFDQHVTPKIEHIVKMGLYGEDFQDSINFQINCVREDIEKLKIVRPVFFTGDSNLNVPKQDEFLNCFSPMTKYLKNYIDDHKDLINRDFSDMRGVHENILLILANYLKGYFNILTVLLKESEKSIDEVRFEIYKKERMLADKTEEFSNIIASARKDADKTTAEQSKAGFGILGIGTAEHIVEGVNEEESDSQINSIVAILTKSGSALADYRKSIAAQEILKSIENNRDLDNSDITNLDAKTKSLFIEYGIWNVISKGSKLGGSIAEVFMSIPNPLKIAKSLPAVYDSISEISGAIHKVLIFSDSKFSNSFALNKLLTTMANFDKSKVCKNISSLMSVATALESFDYSDTYSWYNLGFAVGDACNLIGKAYCFVYRKAGEGLWKGNCVSNLPTFFQNHVYNKNENINISEIKYKNSGKLSDAHPAKLLQMFGKKLSSLKG